MSLEIAPELLADVALRTLASLELDIPDSVAMHKIGVAMRASFDSMPPELQTPETRRELENAATLIAMRMVGPERAMRVAQTAKQVRQEAP